MALRQDINESRRTQVDFRKMEIELRKMEFKDFAVQGIISASESAH
jgi:hypothetical protein